MARTAKRSLADEFREVAKGWRWGRRPVAPRAAEPHTPPAEPWSFPTDWARGPAGRPARFRPAKRGGRAPAGDVHQQPLESPRRHAHPDDPSPEVAEQDRDRGGQGLLLRRVVAVGGHGAPVP